MNNENGRNQRPSPRTPGQREHADPPGCSRDEAQEARRQAAEHGDYWLAERWYWHERMLASAGGEPDYPALAQA